MARGQEVDQWGGRALALSISLALVVYVMGLIGWTPPPLVAALLAALAVGLFVFGAIGLMRLDYPTRLLWRWSAVCGAVAGIALWWWVLVVPQVENGGFEDELLHWSKWETRKDAVSRGEWDRNERKNGRASFRIHHESSLEKDRVGFFYQRIAGLRRNALYRVTFSVKSKQGTNGAVFLTADRQWSRREDIPGGEYQWTQKEKTFWTGDQTYLDVTFVAQAPATIWIDDVSIERAR